MAAKQKNDSSQENDKPKKPATKAPVKKTTAPKPKTTGAAKKTTAKKPVAKKTTPKKAPAKKSVARKTPVKKQVPVVADDDLGLDDISLETNDDAVVPLVEQQKKPEPKKEKAAPIAVPVKPAPAKEEPKVEDNKPSEPDSVKEEEEKGGVSPWLIIILILALAAAAYFIFFKKEEAPEPAAPIIEQKVEEPVVEETPAPQEEVQPVVEPEPEVTAELITISELGGRFYVVVGSFYDEDLAIDKGNDIVATGNNAYLLKPTGDFKLHRVGINVGDRWSEAANGLEELKSLYGDNIWVLKY